MSERMDLGAVSAYAIAVENGFEGTEAEWLESLKGDTGAKGDTGESGKSAYQIAVDDGFSGTESEWLASLKGKKGDAGATYDDTEIKQDIAKIQKTQSILGAKNLLAYPYYDQSQVKNGVTWTINDDTSITVNGTATSYSYIDLEHGNFVPTTNEYIATIKNASWAAVALQVILYDLEQMKNVWQVGIVNPTKITFTNEEIAFINNGTYIVIVRLFINGNFTADNVTVYPMLRLASDTDDTWQPPAPTNYQLNRKVDAIAKGYLSGKSIMVIGDSLTATYQGTSWLKYLCDRVGATAINNATSGAYMAKVAYPDTTDTSVYAKVCESESSMYIDENDVNPDYIIVFAGTNDIRHGTLGTSGNDDVTTVYGALPHICEQLQTRFPNAHLGFITPYKATATQYNYQGFVDAIKSVCAEYSIPVFDNYTYGGVNFRNEAVQAALTRGDGLHLNNKGWEYVSHKFEAFIRSL